MSAAPPPEVATTAVLLAPVPSKLFLAVFKSLTSVQLIPLYNSVKSDEAVPENSPPKTRASS